MLIYAHFPFECISSSINISFMLKKFLHLFPDTQPFCGTLPPSPLPPLSFRPLQNGQAPLNRDSKYGTCSCIYQGHHRFRHVLIKKNGKSSTASSFYFLSVARSISLHLSSQMNVSHIGTTTARY